MSETRLGEAIRMLPRHRFVISTKVGYDLTPVKANEVQSRIFVQPSSMHSAFDYLRDAALRSIEGRLKRVDRSYIDMVAIEGPDEAVDVVGGADSKSRSAL